MSWFFNPFTGKLDYYTGDAITYADDGTYITLSAGGTTLFRFRKSDNQMEIPAGLDTDVSM